MIKQKRFQNRIAESRWSSLTMTSIALAIWFAVGLKTLRASYCHVIHLHGNGLGDDGTAKQCQCAHPNIQSDDNVHVPGHRIGSDVPLFRLCSSPGNALFYNLLHASFSAVIRTRVRLDGSSMLILPSVLQAYSGFRFCSFCRSYGL